MGSDDEISQEPLSASYPSARCRALGELLRTGGYPTYAIIHILNEFNSRSARPITGSAAEKSLHDLFRFLYDGWVDCRKNDRHSRRVFLAPKPALVDLHQ